FGFSYDWNREVSTCDPDYYKWTQFIFTKLFEKGLAYQKEVPVNWCPELKTVLANEEVVDGKSERGGHPVLRVPMKQWMLKITEYSERLLKDIDQLDWPERTKEGQRNWIGKSEGARIQFAVSGTNEKFEVFTTRPDTLFGVTFMVLAPEHPLISQITSKEQMTLVKDYQDQSSRKSEVDRKANEDKTGVFTGAYADHPLHPDQKLPIWVADYVLVDYGTGAIMAVPAHDQRDFEFAHKFNLPVQRVIQSEEALPYMGDGPVVHSDFLNGLTKAEAIEAALKHIEEKNLGKREVQYKLRDWLFSRQRYWGEPFPIVTMEDGGQRTLPIDELPVTLPSVADYEPTEKGEPPLARVKEFVNYVDSVTGKKGLRETDTMPGSAGSSWYFLRYVDPKNTAEAFGFEAQKNWMPVDLYVGGAEHTVGHLLYARFWQKVLFDAGLVSHEEPFQKLAHQGMILGPDHQKMSKSRGNVINPDEVRSQFGADAVRLYICFMGPFEKDKPWATSGIEGVKRFLDRVWRLVADDSGQLLPLPDSDPESVDKLLHKTIKKVSGDIESLSFNTAISALMIFVNEAYKAKGLSRSGIKSLAQLLSPFAPHLCEEIWELLGEKGLVTLAPWPQFDPEKAKVDVVTMAVQVLGKTRGTIEITLDTAEEEALKKAKEITSVQNAIEGKTISKVIYKPGKILNLIVK
ncbi:MAG: leucine--tRNA ligase, partial [Bdellovibrionales bacterium]|nr:leucine--tRNA ligase [Bdellovibrionales bacterium]